MKSLLIFIITTCFRIIFKHNDIRRAGNRNLRDSKHRPRGVQADQQELEAEDQVERPEDHVCSVLS